MKSRLKPFPSHCKVGLLTLLVSLLLSCVYDSVQIKVFPQGTAPKFAFHYAEHQGETVEAYHVTIMELPGHVRVWDLWTYDPSLFYEEVDGRPRLKQGSDVPYDQMKNLPLKELQFGQVPAGWQQYFPKNGEAPQLDPNKTYRIGVNAGGARGAWGSAWGHADFRLSGQCRGTLDSTLEERCEGPVQQS